jgi:uncharacterized damage-inducible protein DinB
MQKSNNIYDLFLHMQWADAAVWQTVLKTVDAEKDEKIKNIFFHIHMVQNAYLCLWEKQPLRMQDIANFKDLPSIANWGQEFYGKVYNFLDHLDEQNLDFPLEIPWIKYFEAKIGKVPNSITIAESLLQVALHSTYHRGQVNARLRILGSEPPLVDYIFWILQGRPAPIWNGI